jgi:hypothetical protein
VRNFYNYLLAASMVMFITAGSIHAAESGPRTYKNVPVGINVLRLYYANTETNGSLNLKSNVGALRYYRYIDFFGNIAAIGGVLPYANAKLTIPAFGLNKTVSGMGDPSFVFGFDFYGAPALTMDEYKNWKQETILGFSIKASAPIGQYDKTSVLNISSNRWIFKPEFAVSHQIADSGLFIESYLHYHFFTKNREYLGNLIRDQNGKWGVDAHLVYEFMRGAFVSFDYHYSWGGETQVNGILQGDAVRDTKIGASLRVPLSRNIAAELRYQNDVNTRNGNKTKLIGFMLQYFW